MIIKILISVFIIFAASRVYLRHREGALSMYSVLFWWLLWGAIGFFTWWPNFSDVVANIIGIGRGLDALLYISIVVLFYFIFRVYIKLEFIEREITSLVRNLAIKEKNTSEAKDLSRNNENTNS